MSWETQSWAAKQRPGSASAKLVLLGLASCADAHHCAYPSVDWLCEFGDLNRKTVIAALQRLEEGLCPFIEDTGERRGRTKQVKVYRLKAEHYGAAALKDGDAKATVPKTGQSQKRNSSGSSSKQSQKRDTEPFREPIPPSDPNGSDSPQGHEQGRDDQEDRKEEAPAGDDAADAKKDRNRGTRLPKDWTPPPLDDLPPQAQALARQWPDGAYATEAEAFVGYWANLPGGKARKLDWVATWANRIVAINSKVLRDAKAGVNFAVQSKPSVAPLPQLPVAAKAAEDDRSAIMHNLLERDIGERTYARYIKPAAITFDDEGVVMIFATDFLRSYVETNLSQRIAVVLSRVAKPGEPQFLKFIVEAPAIRAKQEAQAA